MLGSSTKEKSGVRKLVLSSVHRCMNRGFYTTDIDFVEYDYINDIAVPLFVIDEKNTDEDISYSLFDNGSVKAQVDICNGWNLPFFIVLTPISKSNDKCYFVAMNNLAVNAITILSDVKEYDEKISTVYARYCIVVEEPEFHDCIKYEKDKLDGKKVGKHPIPEKLNDVFYELRKISKSMLK